MLTASSIGHKDWQPWVVDDEAEVDKLLKGAYDRGLVRHFSTTLEPPFSISTCPNLKPSS
jgi:hypothetical protein